MDIVSWGLVCRLDVAGRVDLDITHTPPWTPELMTAAGRRAFGWS